MEKKKFTVEVRETLSRLVEVEAESEVEALRQVENDYRRMEIVLGPEDFVGEDISIYEDR